ncbi:MAG: hypothetical protein ACI4AH_00975 [Muribaculaceae bacterium]
MRKIYSVILLFMLSVLGIAANAETIIVNVDDISRVYYSYNSTDYEFENEGDNTITVSQYSSIYIKAKSGNFITKVVKKSTGGEMSISNMTECYIYNGSDDGETYTVTSVNADQIRDASCTVKVDNASKVLLQRYNNTVVELENGDNTVKFSTTYEIPFTIQSRQSQPLYQVLVNNEVQEASGSYWRINPQTGDVIEVKADFPDQNESVVFQYNSEEAKGAITKVTVDGVEVNNYNDEDFTVKCGSLIEITFNTSDYSINSFSVNGSTQYVYSTYQMYVTGTTNFVLNATKYAMLQLKLTITDPSHITLYKGYSYQGNIVSGLVSGENTIDVSASNTLLQLKANTGCYITSISDNKGTTYTLDYNNCYTINVSEGLEVTVESGATVRDANCTINVDDASLVTVVRSNDSSVELTNGKNTVEFSTESELPLRISSSSYKPLYKVTLDGESVDATGYYYYVSPSNGSVIDITAVLPDENEAVKFVYSDEDAKGIISRVTVDGTEVTNFNEEYFTVKCGQQISIYFNTTDYKLDELKVNGTAQSAAYGSFSSYITAPTTFQVSAHKYGNVNIKLNVTDPEHITVYKGYYYLGNTVSGLVAGENTVEVPENNPTLQIVATSGCYITSVTDNNETTYNADYYGYYTINATEGLEVTVVSGKIERNKKAVIYIDDISAAQYGLNVYRADRSSISVSTGYNTVEFYDGDCPFIIQAYGSSVAKLYRNGEELSPDYTGGTSFSVSLNDGDVVKFFVKSAPSTHNVTLTTNADPQTEISIVADCITDVDANGSFTALTGTELTVAPGNNTELTVTANGEAVSAAADGSFTIVITADTNVAISAKYSGISTIEADAERGNVYNTQGVLVLKAADAASLNTLPAGIYIMNGKKIVVR